MSAATMDERDDEDVADLSASSSWSDSEEEEEEEEEREEEDSSILKLDKLRDPRDGLIDERAFRIALGRCEHLLEQCLTFMRNMRIDCGGAWYDNEHINDYLDMMHLCGTCLGSLDEIEAFRAEQHAQCRAEREQEQSVVNLGLVSRIHVTLSNFACARIKHTIRARPDAKDAYFDTPIVNFFGALCALRAYITDADRQAPSRYYDKAQAEIDYCVRHGLCVSRSPICRYNSQELQLALIRLGVRWRFVPYCGELEEYLLALEDRACDLMTRSYSRVVHNIDDDRTPIGDPKDGLYACSSRMEFKLAVSVLSLWEELSASVRALRADWRSAIQDPLVVRQIMSDAHVIRANLTHEVSKLHSDAVPDEFRKTYRKMGISPPEAYIYLKENNSDVVNPFEVFSQQRRESKWKEYAERSSMDIEVWFERFDDPLAVRILLYLIMRVLVEQHCAPLEWGEFFCSYTSTLSSSDPAIFASALKRSHAVPIFVESFNDACVLWKGRLYVVGSSCNDFLVALALWTRTIQVARDDMISESISQEQLRRSLLCYDRIEPSLLRQIVLSDGEYYSELLARAPPAEEGASSSMPDKRSLVKLVCDMIARSRRRSRPRSRRDGDGEGRSWCASLLGVASEEQFRRIEAMYDVRPQDSHLTRMKQARAEQGDGPAPGASGLDFLSTEVDQVERAQAKERDAARRKREQAAGGGGGGAPGARTGWGSVFDAVRASDKRIRARAPRPASPIDTGEGMGGGSARRRWGRSDDKDKGKGKAKATPKAKEKGKGKGKARQQRKPVCKPRAARR